MFKCNNCNIEFKSYKGLQTHNSKAHDIPGYYFKVHPFFSLAIPPPRTNV